MQYRVFLLTMALGLVFTNSSFGQGPVGDEVMVTFDQSVQVGSHTLPAGKYTIRQVTSASNPRVLEFTSKNGTKLDATVSAIPVLQNTPPSKTRVILDEEAGTPRLDKIWVQGKSYGYQFPGKANGTTVAGNPIGLEGRFTAQAAAPASTTVAQERTPAAPPASVSQSTQREETAVVAQNRPAETPAPARPPEQQSQTTQTPSTEAQTPPPPPAATQNTTPSNSAANSSEDRSTANQNAANQNAASNEVPATALGWMQVALLGMALFTAGAFLYRRERTSR